MWRELPGDTQWWEVEISEGTIETLRVFPRAQWRKLASGSYLLSDIVDRISRNHFNGRTSAFLARLQGIGEHLRRQTQQSSILLIGVNEFQPLTILEGNHRLTAARLISSEVVRRVFRFYAGFSPRMTECCWYQTSLASLYRYALNRLKILMYDREADIARLVGGPQARSKARAEGGLRRWRSSPAPENETPARQAS
jgi:hypothetical protein